MWAPLSISAATGADPAGPSSRHFQVKWSHFKGGTLRFLFNMVASFQLGILFRDGLEWVSGVGLSEEDAGAGAGGGEQGVRGVFFVVVALNSVGGDGN